MYFIEVHDIVFSVLLIQERTAPCTQASEELSLSPIITASSANRNPVVNVTLTLCSSNFYHPILTSTAPILISPGLSTSCSTTQGTPASIPAITAAPQPQGAVKPSLSSAKTSTPLTTASGCTSGVGGATTPQSRTQVVNGVAAGSGNGGSGLVVPARVLPLDSHQLEQPGESPHTLSATPAAANSTHAAQKEAHSVPQNADTKTLDQTRGSSHSQTPHNHEHGGSGSALDDGYCHGSGDDDDVILQSVFIPGGGKEGKSDTRVVTQLDSSEDFQESPLPKTPKKSPKKKTTPLSHRKRSSSGIVTRKRALNLANIKGPQGKPPTTKKVIVTRSMKTASSSRGHEGGTSTDGDKLTKQVNKVSSSGDKPPAVAKVNRPPSSSPDSRRTPIPKPSPVSTPTPATRQTPAAANRPSTRASIGERSSTADVEKSSSSPASRHKPSPVSTPTPATRQTPAAASRPSTRASIGERSSTADIEKSSSSPASRHTPIPKPSPISRPTPATRLTPVSASRPSTRASIGERSNTADIEKSSSGVNVTSPKRISSTLQEKGVKRRLTERDSDEAQGPTSPRKKARSSEPSSPQKDSGSLEIALHTRGLFAITPP